MDPKSETVWLFLCSWKLAHIRKSFYSVDIDGKMQISSIQCCTWIWEGEQACFPDFHTRKGIFYTNGFTGSIKIYAEFKAFQSMCHVLLRKLMEFSWCWTYWSGTHYDDIGMRMLSLKKELYTLNTVMKYCNLWDTVIPDRFTGLHVSSTYEDSIIPKKGGRAVNNTSLLLPIVKVKMFFRELFGCSTK